jgi:acyl-CoA synthetase (AMP-forming)/AMP-acid ligase II
MKQHADLLPSTTEQSEAEAVLAENGRRTWGQLESNARRFAQALESLGLEVGDRWAFLAHNRVQWPELALGNMRAGTRYVPLNWHLTVPELVYLLQDSGANMLIVDPVNEEKGRAAALESGIDPARIFVLGPDFDAWLTGFPDSRPRDETAGAALLYTGGTTGRSKGVIRSDTGGPVTGWVEAANLWASAVYMPEKGIALIRKKPKSYWPRLVIPMDSLLRSRSVMPVKPKWIWRLWWRVIWPRSVSSWNWTPWITPPGSA